MSIMKFGPNNEILSISVNFGQPETLRLQIIFLKKRGQGWKAQNFWLAKMEQFYKKRS